MRQGAGHVAAGMAAGCVWERPLGQATSGMQGQGIALQPQAELQTARANAIGRCAQRIKQRRQAEARV